MLYNPATMSNPGTILSHISEADTNSRIVQMRLKLHPAYANREDAVKEDTSRMVMFYENGVLYEALRTASWEWKPCTKPMCEPGINWDTFYAPTISGLYNYVKSRYTTISDFKPRLHDQGLYQIQVHYDGQCRY